MALKRLFVDIQKDLFDIWEFTSAEAEDEYNEYRGDFDYNVVLNKTVQSKNLREKVYKFQIEEERDEVLYMLKEKLQGNPNVYFLGEDDGSMDEDEFNRHKLPVEEDE